ncbi:YbbR-like domain-containing protein [Paenibacillus sp. YYML68]|uniref:CdaR family protein n=1 Tax=Paenibacillus sp. YYML68 TaxID=2909250 RepID=UPI00249365EA|nr:CdaR family protein [Paenibacillus sp. YYML68]
MDQWLRNTNVVKIVALMIGILLWAVVRADNGTVTSSNGFELIDQQIGNVSITPKYDSAKFYIESIQPAQVTVTLSGRDSALKKAVNNGNFSVELDLTSAQKGEHVLPLKPIGFPSNVTVSVTPSNVKVVIEEKSNKSMPVTVNVTGIPGVGLKAGQPVVKPKQVTVSVPSSKYELVDSVRADVNVEKATSAVTKKATLEAYDKDGQVIEEATISPNVVDVEVPITSPFTLVPLQIKLVGQPPRGYAVAEVRQSTDKVTVYGPQSLLDRMEFYEGPQADLSDLKQDVELTLAIPLRNQVKQLEPDEVKVQVTIVPSVTKTLEAIPLSFVGQNDGFETKVVLPESGQLNLTVEGAPALLEKLKPQDVQAILDVSNLPPGRHEVSVTWNLPTFVKKELPQDFKATVEISAKQVKPSTEPAATP